MRAWTSARGRAPRPKSSNAGRSASSASTSASVRPAARACFAVPYRICSTGLTPVAATRMRNATLAPLSDRDATSGATQAPWLKPHRPSRGVDVRPCGKGLEHGLDVAGLIEERHVIAATIEAGDRDAQRRERRLEMQE